MKLSLRNLITLSVMVVAGMLVIVVWTNWFFYEQKNFNLEYADVENKQLSNHKELVKREVERAVNQVAYVRSLSKDNLMKDLTYRVDMAYDIAKNLYDKNKGTKTDAEIKAMIKEALRPYRTGQSSEYVFIYTLDGVSVLLPDRPKDEGVASLHFRDTRQNNVIEKEVALMREVDKGFLTYRKFDSSTNDSVAVKYSYIRKFKPLNWYIGSKIYFDDFENNVKKEILRNLASIHFKHNGYLFVQGVDCEPILSNGTIVREGYTNFVNVDLQERKKVSNAVLNNQEYVEYVYHKPGDSEVQPKISYVKRVQGWDWIIGAGFYPRDLQTDINAQRNIIRRGNTKTLIIISSSMLLIILLSYLYTRRVIMRIMDDFTKYEKFFDDALIHNTKIDERELEVFEFKKLAKSANRMIDSISSFRAALEKEHSLLNSVINSIPDMIFFKDLQSKYIAANSAFCEYLGLDIKNIRGKTDIELFPSELARVYYEYDQTILRDGIPIRNEEWIGMPNGTKRLYDTVKVLCQDDAGRILGILCISRDITERQHINEQYLAAKEKAEESDRLKTAFLANMSHEIRTPMNSIVGFSNLIAQGGLSDEEKVEYVEHIETSINSLLTIINDIIDIAKIEAGQLTIKPQYVSLNEIMDDIKATIIEYKRRLDKDHLAFNLHIDNELKNARILVDKYRIIQVLDNLLINAVKFTEHGSIELGCRIVDQSIHFYIKDTGIGISVKDQKKLFERFRQVGTKQGYKMGGTGLGLAISKHIVDMMKGSIEVESEPGQGSVFHIYIPYFPDQNHLNKQYNLKSLDFKDHNIMVIEEEDVAYNYFKAVISGTGAHLIRAKNIAEATEAIEKEQELHLCYADIDVEEKGMELFLQKLNEVYPGLPVIGQINENQKAQVAQYGFSKLIYKPVKYHLLLESISKCLKKQNSV